MASPPKYTSDQYLDMCVLDYVIKKGMHRTAEVFREEAAVPVCSDSIVVDEPDGFLKKWWSFIHETYAPNHFKNQESGPDKAPVIPGNALLPIYHWVQMHKHQDQATSSCSAGNHMGPTVAGSSASVRKDEEQFINAKKSKFWAEGANEGRIAQPLNECPPKDLRPPSILHGLNSPEQHFISYHGGFSSNSSVWSCDFSSNGKLLAGVGCDQVAYIGNIETWTFTTIPNAHELPISSVRFNPIPSATTILATSSIDQTVMLWDAATFTKIGCLEHSSPAVSVDFNPVGASLCSCTSTDVRYWNYEVGNCLYTWQGPGRAVRFQPPPKMLLAIAAGNSIHIFDTRSWCFVFSLMGHVKVVTSICWHPDGNLFASVSEDAARIWDMGSGNCIYQLDSNGLNFRSCVFDRRFPLRLIIGADKFMTLWIPDKAHTSLVHAHNGAVTDIAASPDKELLASAGVDHKVSVWRLSADL